MANHATAELYKDMERDKEREYRVNERMAKETYSRSSLSGQEEGGDNQTSSEPLVTEDVVEIIAPLLKEKPLPLLSFDDPCIPEFVKHVVRNLGFIQPTIIQKYCSLLFISDPHRTAGC